MRKKAACLNRQAVFFRFMNLLRKGNGAGEEDRTLDIHLGKVALYR